MFAPAPPVLRKLIVVTIPLEVVESSEKAPGKPKKTNICLSMKDIEQQMVISSLPKHYKIETLM